MKKISIALYFLLLSILLRWPLSLYGNWDAVPLEPNFPLHAVAAWDLSLDGTPFHNEHLEWPVGAPVRYLAWTLLLIAVPLEAHFLPIEAFNLATLLWIWGQGLGLYWLFSKWFRSEIQRFSGASLSLIAPQTLIALGNGQFENFAPFFLFFCFWAAQEKRFFATLLGLLACCFSSPYIGFLALLLVFITAKFQPKILFSLVLSALATFFYYQPVSTDEVHESTMPAPSELPEKADLLNMFIPQNKALNSGKEVMSAKTRWKKIFEAPSPSVYDNKWPWLLTTSSSFLGLSFLFFGGQGLILNRDPRFRSLLHWGVLSTLFSLGTMVYIGFARVPFLWQISKLIPGLEHMQATSRFLFAPSLVLVLGICLYPNRKRLPLIILLCILETLFITPAHWPIPSRKITPHPELEDIETPVAFWPAAPSISSHKITMLSLVIRQPLALFSDMEATPPTPRGIHKAGQGKNRQNQTAQEWNAQIKQETNILLQFRGDFENNQYKPIKFHQQQCSDSYCRWYLNPIKPEY